MKAISGLILLLAAMGSASALTPLPDRSAEFFAGEWVGTGDNGSYCYLNLSIKADGRLLGTVLIDGGAGDWLGAQVRWRNQQQGLAIEEITPLPFSARQRLMPLETFELHTGLNRSLGLHWNAHDAGCHLQKLDAMARHLDHAREALESATKDDKKR
jgi:hypothetical protein